MDITSQKSQVSPVVQFICLLAPIVLTGFYLVYALVGFIIEGQSKLRWCDEALEVGVFVTMITVGLNAMVMGYAWFSRVRLKHVLWISPAFHIGVAIILTLLTATVVEC